MEIVDNTATTKPTESKTDSKLIKKLETKFDKAQKAFGEQEYSVEITKETLTFLNGSFSKNLKFKGYASYGIDEVFKAVEMLKNGKGKWKREYVEAIFHFIKEYEGVGLSDARSHRALSDEIAPTMEIVQQNGQNLKDLATELEAAIQGIPVEDFVKAMSQSQQGPPGMPTGPR
jgi:hypothetical protein